jgi:hypothetical protein
MSRRNASRFRKQRGATFTCLDDSRAVIIGGAGSPVLPGMPRRRGLIRSSETTFAVATMRVRARERIPLPTGQCSVVNSRRRAEFA